MDLEGLYNPERDGNVPSGAQVIRNMGLDPDQLLDDALANARVLKETQIKTKPDHNGNRMVLNQVGPRVNGEVHYIVNHEKVNNIPQQNTQVPKEPEWDDNPDLDDPQECWFFQLTDEEKKKIKQKHKFRRVRAAKSLFRRTLGVYSHKSDNDTALNKLQRRGLQFLGMTFSGLCTKGISDVVIDHSMINNENGEQELVKLPHDMLDIKKRVKSNQIFNVLGNTIGNAMTAAGSLTSTNVEASTKDMAGVVAARVARVGAHFAKDYALGKKIIKDFGNLNTDKIYTELVSDNTSEAEGVTNFLKLLKKHEILEAAATTGVDIAANFGEGLLALSNKTSNVSEMLSSCAPIPGGSSAIKYGVNHFVMGTTSSNMKKYLRIQESRDLIGKALDVQDEVSIEPEVEVVDDGQAPVYNIVELAKANKLKKRKI